MNKFLGFLVILLVFTLAVGTSLFAADKSSDDESSITHWMVKNQTDFDKILEETARKSHTKWIVNENEVAPAVNSASKVESKKEVSSSVQNKDVVHIVKEKETIYSIAKKYNIKPEEIKKLNKIDNNIFVGEKLIIKKQELVEETSTKTEYPEFSYYKVKDKDSLFSIAKIYDMSPEELVNLNKDQLDPNNPLVFKDMILKVRNNYTKKNVLVDTLKFNWPVVGRILLGYGVQKNGITNEGINIMAHKGTPVKATEAGVVIYTGDAMPAFGNIILIQHQNKWVSIYGYVDGISVKKGQEVKKGQNIAKVSDVGNATRPELHFELRKNIKPQDPLKYLNSNS